MEPRITEEEHKPQSKSRQTIGGDIIRQQKAPEGRIEKRSLRGVEWSRGVCGELGVWEKDLN